MHILSGAFPVLNSRTAKAVDVILLTDDVVFYDATAAAIGVTLPTPAAVHAGRAQTPFILKKIDASANAVTITGSIDGAASAVLSAQNDAIVLFTDGLAYYILSNVSSGGGGGGVGQQPSFAVTMSANQTVVANTYTKVALDTVSFDTAGDYDNVLYRHTPTLAGKYLYGFKFDANNIAVADLARAALYKNGAIVTVSQIVIWNNNAAAAEGTGTVLIPLDMNGITDYVEFWGRTSGTIISGFYTHAFGSFLIA